MSDRLQFGIGRTGNGKPSIIIDDEIVSPDKIVEALDMFEALKQKLAQVERERDEAVRLLEIANCPQCDGSGAIAHPVERIESNCCGRPLSSGECCGNPVPIPVQDIEFEECQFCAEKSAFLANQNTDKE